MAGITSGGGSGGVDYVQDTEPADPSEGEVWLDTSVDPYRLKAYDAAAATWELQVPVAGDSTTLQGNSPSDLRGHDYKQNTAPSSPSDGESWVDTSDPARPVKVYSTDRGEWVPTYENVPLFVTQEAITFGESELSATLTDTTVSNGSVKLPNLSSETLTDSKSASTSYRSGEQGWSVTLNEPTETFDAVINSTFDETLDEVRINASDGTNLWSASSSATGGDTVTFGPYSFEAGKKYHLVGYSSSSVYFPYVSGEAASISGSNFDAYSGSDGSSDISDWYLFDSVTFGEYSTTSGSVTAEWSAIQDMAAWDRVTGQKEPNAGSVSWDIEVNDGSGWSTYATDVAMPHSIASVAPDSDVRIVANLSRPSTSDTSPRVPYVARRAER